MRNACHWEYCKKVLPLVSRTFALNIALLPKGVKEQVLLAYLLCRVVDTVEDAPNLSAEQKVDAMLAYPDILKSSRNPRVVDTWCESLAAAEIEGKQEHLNLLYNTKRLFSFYDSLPKDQRLMTLELIKTMSAGFCSFISKNGDGKIRIDSMGELRSYCYYAAGCVGEYLSKVFTKAINIKGSKKDILQANCVSFGLALQMVNIAKDVKDDYEEGRSFLPRELLEPLDLTIDEFVGPAHPSAVSKVYQHFFEEIHEHLEKALRFTLALPPQAYRIRLFCLIPLALAEETARALLDSSQTAGALRVKVKRSTVKKVLARSMLCAPFDGSIQSWFRQYGRTLRTSALPETV